MEFIKDKSMAYPDTAMFNYVKQELENRGVTLEAMAEVVVVSQVRFLPDLTVDEAVVALEDILHKREIMNAVSLGLVMDEQATKGELPEPLQSIIQNDLGVYGEDEWVSIGLSLTGGSIATTNYGKLDVDKTGLISKLDKDTSRVNTFLDDLVGALIATAESKLAHQYA